MSSIKATVRNGRIEPDEPLDLPEGTRLLIPVPNGPTGRPDDENPMSQEEIDSVLAAMDRIIPFGLSPEEEARLEADRLARKDWEKAHFSEHAEKLRRMWE